MQILLLALTHLAAVAVGWGLCKKYGARASADVATLASDAKKL